MSKKSKDKKKGGAMLPDLTKVETKEVDPTKVDMSAVAPTPAVDPTPAVEKKVAKILPVQLAILPLMRTAKTIANLAAAATVKLGAEVTERQVRLAIDRARRGTNKENPINIDRVAPNTFQIVPKAAVAATA